MIKLTDEILNKFIDGDLNEKIYLDVQKQLNNSPEDFRKFKELKKIHLELMRIKEDEISVGFTEKVMEKVRRKAKAKQLDKYFIFSISTFIMLIIFVLVGIMLSQIINISGASTAVSVGDHIANYASRFSSILYNIFDAKSISIFGMVISLGLVISVFAIYDSHKKAKDSLSKLH